MRELLTIVIPSKNEDEYIYSTLKSISSQYFFNRVKIIISDAGSTDNTLGEIKRAKIDFDLNIEVIEGGPVAVGRNRGASLADTKYLCFIDADSLLLSKLILIKCLMATEVRKYELVGCRVKSVSNDIPSKISFSIFNIIQRWFMREAFCTGMFFFISSEKFHQIGGFDESVQHSEDYLLSRLIPKKKFKIIRKYVGQDNRRFKKMGYFVFFWFLIKNFFHRNDKQWFTKDIGYWL